jgi:ABC-type transport system involved in cytochrome c biogenesis permease subunit
MKNTFTVIEKIALTLLAITFPLFVIGIFIVCIWGKEMIGLYLVLPFGVCVGIVLILAFIFELLLCRIWGLDLHVFPSLFKE